MGKDSTTQVIIQVYFFIYYYSFDWLHVGPNVEKGAGAGSGPFSDIVDGSGMWH